ncbi:hypothetical protein [Brenneria corticis]|uniref:Uncharacterized protein n=1 Tax=Brenneria corticis TaxID=2173106 RepID=A0A2U1TU83_9GAMM|nr:hypothetical protein [Brenneria sp. CFCC 11842]PWC12949.1 hypothetical protein DDT56_16080 [Brenneria sp. CFCC 11842]
MVNPIAPHVVSGKLLSPEKTPIEALTALRTYFDELAKHQEFIAMAWGKHYDTCIDSEWIRDPINARMRSAMCQVTVMVTLVEDELQAIERQINTEKPTSREVRHV